MAVFNEILVGRFARSVQKLFGVKASPPVNALSSDVMAVYKFESGVDNFYLEGWQRYGSMFTLAASVGNAENWRARNPQNSNFIAVFESIALCNFTAVADQAILLHGPTAADLASVFSLNQIRFDPRGQANSQMVFSSQASNVGITAGTTRQGRAYPINGSAEFIVHEGQEMTVLPGDCIHIVQQTVNQQIVISVTWRERFLEDSERT